MDEQRIWALLRELDDPDCLEFPRGYDHAAARARFNRLAALLERQFDCACDVDRQAQDASFHGIITIPAEATRSGEHITVTVSNFGSLVAPTLGNPGTYDQEEEDILLDGTDRRRVGDALEALGYIAIPEHVLWSRYDGACRPLSHSYPPDNPPSWWIRYFDYL